MIEYVGVVMVVSFFVGWFGHLAYVTLRERLLIAEQKHEQHRRRVYK